MNIVYRIINWIRGPKKKEDWGVTVNKAILEYLKDQKNNHERDKKLLKILREKGRL